MEGPRRVPWGALENPKGSQRVARSSPGVAGACSVQLFKSPDKRFSTIGFKIELPAWNWTSGTQLRDPANAAGGIQVGYLRGTLF